MIMCYYGDLAKTHNTVYNNNNNALLSDTGP